LLELLVRPPLPVVGVTPFTVQFDDRLENVSVYAYV